MAHAIASKPCHNLLSLVITLRSYNFLESISSLLNEVIFILLLGLGAASQQVGCGLVYIRAVAGSSAGHREVADTPGLSWGQLPLEVEPGSQFSSSL